MMREDSLVERSELSDSLNNVFLEDAVAQMDLFAQTDNGLLTMEESSSDTGPRCWSQAAGSLSDTSSQESGRVRELEEEQERLTNSLLSLSSHFAQVQFRLKQINEAQGPDRDRLLADLHNFAFRGCTDVAEFKRQISLDHIECGNQEEAQKERKEKQMMLINQLREQLRDLETFAYETGDGGLPSNEVMTRQKAVLDKLYEKLQLNLELDTLSQTDLQNHIDGAIKQLDVPLKAKDQLVDQLQTQIVDLERFVNFLQAETGNDGKPPLSISSINNVVPRKPNPVLSLVGCQSRRFERNELKNTLKGNHYGDQRAHLEIAVSEVAEIMSKYMLLNIAPDEREHLSGERKEQEIFDRSEEAIVTAVRKKLCPSLRSLLEHGMYPATKPITSGSYIPFGCFSMRNKGQLIESAQTNNTPTPLTHIWDVILFYYNSKNGREFSDAPVRKLSQSFNLEAVGGRQVTSKQMLLSTVENIIASHSRLKRSPDAMWKAFVSAAINEKKLPAWIRIIFRTRQIVEMCFSSWSFIARTGCEDIYPLLEKLHAYNFELPVDLAVRPFQQMKHAF